MPNISKNLLHRLDTLNNWLGDVYDDETDLSILLSDSGFNELEIEQIKQEYLSEFLEAIMELMAGNCTTPREEGRNKLMSQVYGLIDGKPQDRYAIGRSIGVCGERVRQLVSQQISLLQNPDQQEKLQNDFATIGRELLGS